MSIQDGLSAMCDVYCQAKDEGSFFFSDSLNNVWGGGKIPLIINPGNRWRWMDSFSSRCPGRKRTRYHWVGDCLGQREAHYIWTGRRGKFKGFEDLK